MKVVKLVSPVGLCVFALLCGSAASAQTYGGGGTPVTSGSGYSYGSKGVIIAAVAGVAAAAGVVYWLMHRQQTITGCAESSAQGMKLETGTGHTFQLDTTAADVPSGRRVTLQGIAEKSPDGDAGFRVLKVKHNYGSCA